MCFVVVWFRYDLCLANCNRRLFPFRETFSLSLCVICSERKWIAARPCLLGLRKFCFVTGFNLVSREYFQLSPRFYLSILFNIISICLERGVLYLKLYINTFLHLNYISCRSWFLLLIHECGWNLTNLFCFNIISS